MNNELKIFSNISKEIDMKMSNVDELFLKKASDDTEIKILLYEVKDTTMMQIFKIIHDKLTNAYQTDQLNMYHKIILLKYKQIGKAKQEYKLSRDFSSEQLTSIGNNFILESNNGELPYDFSFLTTENPDLFTSLILSLKSDLNETGMKLSNARLILGLIYLYL